MLDHGVAELWSQCLGGAYDEFGPRSYVTWEGGTKEQLERREVLRGAMEREGFFVYPWEWWHFDFKDWSAYPILDVPFEKLGKPSAPAVPAAEPPVEVNTVVVFIATRRTGGGRRSVGAPGQPASGQR